MSDDTQQVADDGASDAEDGLRFRLGFVPGATPGKWARTWAERLPEVPLELVQVAAADAAGAVRERRVDAVLARLPVDKDVLHAIALYSELPVVVVSRDHLLAATEESEHLTVADLDDADDVTWLPADDVLFAEGDSVPGRAPSSPDPQAADDLQPATTADAIAWAATGVGMVVVPMSLARLHHRKDVVHRVLDDGPESAVGLVWLRDGLPEDVSRLVEEMVGIVRGRTANSSRGRGSTEPPLSPTRKAKAKRAAEAAGSGRSGRGTPPSGRRGPAGRRKRR